MGPIAIDNAPASAEDERLAQTVALEAFSHRQLKALFEGVYFRVTTSNNKKWLARKLRERLGCSRVQITGGWSGHESDLLRHVYVEGLKLQPRALPPLDERSTSEAGEPEPEPEPEGEGEGETNCCRSWQACPFEHGEASCPNCEALELVVIRVLAGLKNPCSREP